MRIMKFCKPYLMTQKARLSLFIILSLLGSAISIVSPYVLGDFIDNLVDGANEATIIRFCILFGGISIFKILKDYLTSMLFTKMQVKLGYRLNIDVIKHIQSLSVSYSNKKDGAYLNQRINGDCTSITSFCLTVLRDTIINTALIVIPMIILYILNKLILAILLSFILLYVVIYYLLKNRIYRTGMLFRESQAKYYASLFEQLKHMAQIKINSVQPEYLDRADGVFHEYNDTAIKSQRINFIYTSFDGIVATFAQIALFVVGGLLVIRGKFTIGLFTVFSSYFRVMLTSCRFFFSLAASYQSVSVSYNRTMDILKSKPESNGSTKLPAIDTIELKNVKFSYETYEQLQKEDLKQNQQHNPVKPHPGSGDPASILHSPDFVFSKGNLYTITGKNGSGKTTLTKLLIGLYIDERNGEIYYNSLPMKELDMVYARRELIGYAEQNPLLVEDSIYYNLTYQPCPSEYADIQDWSGTREGDPLFNQILHYANILNMEAFLQEKQLSFRVNAQNNNLSGGERQKLAILKVLLKNTDVMVFDEPTSALDKETKDRFIQFLSQLKQDKIIFVVTHDKDLISSSDQIIDIH